MYCVYSNSRMPCVYESASICQGKLNCEHTVPQSFFGSSDPMVSDVMHLRPSWSAANGGRSNFPFVELADDKATQWFGPNFHETQTKPLFSENYSAGSKSQFRPRKADRTDVARVVAYFFSRYPTQAGNVTSVFPSVDTMIEWSQIPITDLQYAQYQRASEV